MKKMSALAVENLSKHFGKIKAVDDVSFEVESKEIFGFLGPNGAGKTTTIRSCLGLLKPTSGKISFFGKEVDPYRDVAIRKRIGYLPGELGLYKDMTTQRIINHYAKLSKVEINRDYINEISQRLNIDMTRAVGKLSKGNKQKIGILLTLMGDYDFLCLDEPTSGLDPLMQLEFEKILVERQKETGCAIFLSSHILAEVDKLCNRVAIIRNGKIIETSSISDLKMKNLKHFTVDFSTAKGKSDFKENLITKYKDLTVKNDHPTQLVFDLPPIYKFDILSDIQEAWDGQKIMDFKIEDSSLEAIFMKYYKGEDEQ